jgi:prepilin-type N-terminal cleavage/methylation domain-containing protein
MTTRETRAKQGFSLVEVLVALTLLSIIFMGLARVSFQMAAAARSNSTIAKRTAVIIQEANKFNAMSFSALSAYNNTSSDLTYGDLTFQRRITVTSQKSDNTRYLIKIVITPYIGGTLTTSLKDSTWVYRSNPPGSPLCTSC